MNSNQVAFIIKSIREIKDLKPSNEVNQIFSKLVDIALSENTKYNVTQKDKKYIQSMASRAEYELEKYWANLIISGDKKLEDFIYYNNYVKLTKLEWMSLLSCKIHKRHKVLFIGSGPLPLTSIVLSRDFNCNVTLLDSSTEAINLSKQLLNKINLDNKFEFINEDAIKFNGYGKYDVIYFAALAGAINSLKKKILDKIKRLSKDDVHLIVRSSFGNREILYRRISNKDIEGYKVEVEVKPHNDVVNSFLILKK